MLVIKLVDIISSPTPMSSTNFQISCPEFQRYQNWNATNQKLWLMKSKKTREDRPPILHLMVKLIDYPDDDVILRWRHDDVTLTFLCIITSQSNHMLTNLKYWDQLKYTIKHKTVKRELLFRVTVLFTVHATHSEIRWVRIPFSAVDLRSLLLTEIVVNKYHRWSKTIYESHIRYNVCFTSIFIE